MDGAAAITFADTAGVTRLEHLYHRAPLRVLFPAPQPGDVPLAALVTTSGGLVGGDRLRVDATVRPGAAAMVAGQAAEKVYRSAGADVRVAVTLTAEEGAWLEWLPQETILFDGARLRRQTTVDIAPGGRILAGEMLVFGRTARGERLKTGLVHDAWEVSKSGRRVWSDAFRLEGDLERPLDHPAGLDGATAYATAVYVGDDAADRLAAARGFLKGAGVRAAATCVAGVLIVRWLGDSGAAVRLAFGLFWCGFRGIVAGLPPSLPRLWHV